MLRALAGLLVPPRCAICARAVAADDVACPRCRAALAALGPVRSTVLGLEVLSAARYEGAAQRLVAALKFSGRLPLADLAAEAMAVALAPALAPSDGFRRTVRRFPSFDDGATPALVPVPAAPARRRRRGFDPATLLAAALARRTGWPVASCLRRHDGPRQVGRRRADRLADPPRVQITGAPPSRAVWIVDDVATTGATLLACAAVLRAAGADDVRAVTLARKA